jgi:hypothetical protein
MLGFLVELLFICLKCPLARMPSLPHILTKPITLERVCCLLVLNSVTSTPQWIRQPKPRVCVIFLRDIYFGFVFIFILFYLLFCLFFIFLVLVFFCLFSVLFLLIEYCKGGVPVRQFIHASGLLTSIF